MMLKTLASGSKGNAYEVYDGETLILLEPGINPKQLRALSGRKLTDYKAVLLTHEHGDHSKAAGYLAALGLPVYMTAGTRDALGLPDAKTITPGKAVKIGSFVVLAFKTAHDAAEPVGYVIKSAKTGEVLLFATDTAYIANTFAGLTEIAIEANYDEALLADSALKDSIKQRIRRSHMSIETALKLLSRNDLNHVELIHLIHLSGANSDTEGFRDRVYRATGIKTNIY